MTEPEMKEVCRHLRAAAPQEWDEFVRMFTEYTATAVDEVSEADAANIMTVKGFAQANKSWLKLFTHLDPQLTYQVPLTPYTP